MYDGSLGPQLNDYFANKGFVKPDDYNIADWILVSSKWRKIVQTYYFLY